MMGSSFSFIVAVAVVGRSCSFSFSSFDLPQQRNIVVVVVVQLSTRFREVWGQLKAREARGIETKNDRNTDRQAGLKSDKQNARGKGNKTRNRSWNHGYPFNERRAGDGEGCGLVLDVGVRWLVGWLRSLLSL